MNEPKTFVRVDSEQIIELDPMVKLEAGARVLDTFPADLTCAWQSLAGGGANAASSGSGAGLDDTLSLQARSAELERRKESSWRDIKAPPSSPE